MQVQLVAPALPSVLVGVFQLHPQTFVRAMARGGQNEIAIALAFVLIAGLSGAVGQSIVLFANRVKPARFIFSLLVDALLFTFGYAFLVASTWCVCHLLGVERLDVRSLAIVFALSYAPLLLSFLGAVPYLGTGIAPILRVWHLLAMIVGIAAVGAVDVFQAASFVWLGWIVSFAVQRSVGKPVVQLGQRMLDAVAGVRLVADAQALVGRSEFGGGARPRPVAVAPRETTAHSNRWVVAFGLGGVALLAVIVALALDPVRGAIFGWQAHLPALVQLPMDLAWLAVIAVLVTAFIAPLETLGWWAGWYGDDIDVADEAVATAGATQAKRYIVYLDGIAQSSSQYTADIETFLDALTPQLSPDVRLVRGVMAYSVVNRPLDSDPIFSPFWRFVEARRLKHMDSLAGWFVNLRNVLVVGVSADPRYGPMYNFGIASVIYRSLLAHGYVRGSGVPVTLIGYSGGGQMACGSARFLKRALDAPIDVISLGGVISGTDPILGLEGLYHLVGTKDGVQRLGPIMFASRWKIAVLSYWNRAKRLGVLTEISLGPVGHQVPGGMLDPDARLADGRTNLQQTLDVIHAILDGRVAPPAGFTRKTTNYARYVAVAPDLAPLAVVAPPYRPVAPWVGRLILPARDARFEGAFFEVWHAPDAHARLRGRTVRLGWSELPDVRERRKAVVRDVTFSARANFAERYGGCVMPTRLNRWRMVDPLESLAGARPHDDTVVKFERAAVDIEGDCVTLRIEREPVQITGAYYGLVRFVAPAEGDGYAVVHYDASRRTFEGRSEIVRLPAIAADANGRPNSVCAGVEETGLNASGWYVYGCLDCDGRFVVQALAPRALLQPQARSVLADATSARRYVRRAAWRDIVAHPGDVVTAGNVVWQVGDVGLLVHTYGGVRSTAPVDSVTRRMYRGHFAYGAVEVVRDPVADEPRLEIVYRQVYRQNSDGITSGAQHWSRYMGDRQFGWAGVRPVCDAILKFDAFDLPFDLEDATRGSALEAFMMQLEVMTARYRIGDGAGGVFVGPAKNSAQDSNRALFATLRALRRFDVTHPEFARAVRASGRHAGAFATLQSLARDLQRKLEIFGVARRDWSANEYTLASTLEDSPLRNLALALASWRSTFPRLAGATAVDVFVRHGAGLHVLGSSQLGGKRSDVTAIAPFMPWYL